MDGQNGYADVGLQRSAVAEMLVVDMRIEIQHPIVERGNEHADVTLVVVLRMLAQRETYFPAAVVARLPDDLAAPAAAVREIGLALLRHGAGNGEGGEYGSQRRGFLEDA